MGKGWGRRRPSGGKLQRMQSGEGPSGVHTFQIPLLCRRSSWTPRPRAFTAQGRGWRNPRAPASQHSTLATLPWGTRSGEAQCLGGRRGGRGARRRERRAGGGLAARPHVAGAGGGGRGAEGEGLHLREVPGWSQPLDAERFSCPAGSALQTREKFPRKKCSARRGALESPGATAR